MPAEGEEVVAQSTEEGQRVSPAALGAEETGTVQPPGEEATVQETSAMAVEQVVPQEAEVEASGAATPDPELAKAAPAAAAKETASPAPPAASSSGNGASAATISATVSLQSAFLFVRRAEI